MNHMCEKLLAVTDVVERGEIAMLLIAHRGRLARFGFDYLEHVAEWKGCAILVANQESLSPREEMIQDLLSIVYTFSCRLHGLGGYDRQRSRLPDQHSNTKGHCQCGERNIRNRSTLIKE